MYSPVIRLNHVRGHLDFVGRDMLVLNSIIVGINEEVQGNSNIGERINVVNNKCCLINVVGLL